MAVLYLIPRWFYGTDIGLTVLFSLVTLAVAAYSFRICKLCGQKEPKYFGWGFLLIGLSYLSRAFFNFIVARDLRENLDILEVQEINMLSHWSIHIYIVLFTIGLISLVYMTAKTKKDTLYPLLLFLALAPIGLLWGNSNAMTSLFYIVSVGILAYLCIHYFLEWRRNRNPGTRNMLIAFFLLTLASFDLSFSINHYVHYVISHTLEFVAFVIILSNLIGITKHEQKKK